MKFLLDMNLSPKWVEWLSGAGLDSVHWSSVGDARATDSELVGFAAATGAVVITHDLGFGEILAATQRKKPSVVLIRARDARPEVIGERVISALRQTATDLEQGVLVSVDADRFRVRILPLPPRSRER